MTTAEAVNEIVERVRRMHPTLPEQRHALSKWAGVLAANDPGIAAEIRCALDHHGSRKGERHGAM